MQTIYGLTVVARDVGVDSLDSNDNHVSMSEALGCDLLCRFHTDY